MNHSALFRRDPPNWKKGFSKNSGFTAIEAMVVLAIFAIIAATALPSYQTLLEKRRVTSAALQTASFISAAKMESLKRSDFVSVNYKRNNDHSWCVGLVVGQGACDCMEPDPAESDACTIDSQLRVLTHANINHPVRLTGVTGDGSFVFDPIRGLMTSNGDAMALNLASELQTYELDVQTGPTGRVGICSASSSKNVPGYDVCP